MGEHPKVAVILARGGSKRIPRKNVKPLGGGPLITHTIEAAIEAAIFDRVIVSTDDEEIADVARCAGAEVPFMRTAALADDFAPSSKVTIDALQRLGLDNGIVAQLMPNCPFRSAADIKRSFQTFCESPSTALLSIWSYGSQSPYWAMRMDADRELKRLFPDKLKQRSQDLEKLYCPTGAIWWSGVARLLEFGTFYSAGFRGFELQWENAFDIDDPRDWKLAEFIWRQRESQANGEP